jgi:hypothetical protein
VMESTAAQKEVKATAHPCPYVSTNIIVRDVCNSHHSNFSMRQREALGTICERHGTFSRRVKRRKDVDEHGNETKMRWAALRNEET